MSDLARMPAGVSRNAAFYAAARKGDLEYADVRSSQDAEWAANGLRDGLSFGNFPSDEAKSWAIEFMYNLDCDFG